MIVRRKLPREAVADTRIDIAELPEPVTVVGDKVAVTPAGIPVTASPTVWEGPASVTVTVDELLAPRWTVPLAGLSDSEKDEGTGAGVAEASFDTGEVPVLFVAVTL